LVPLPQNTKAKQVVCGVYHTVVLLDNDQVIGFGSNKRGEIGVNELPWSHPDVPDLSSPYDQYYPTPTHMRFW